MVTLVVSIDATFGINYAKRSFIGPGLVYCYARSRTSRSAFLSIFV